MSSTHSFSQKRSNQFIDQADCHQPPLVRPMTTAIHRPNNCRFNHQGIHNRFTTFFILLLAIASVSFPRPATAASLQNLKSLSLEALGNIEVTIGGKTPQQADDIAAAVTIISKQEIANSAATNIPELLRLVPGLYVARLTGNRWAISSRGFSGSITNKLLVMIDGRSVYNPLFGGVWWDEQGLMLADLERIEVIRGPGATIWGANAVNGVINIITQSAERTQGNLTTTIIGQHQREFSVRHGGKIGNDAHYRIYAKQRNQSATWAVGRDNADDESRNSRSGFRLDWQPGQNKLITLDGGIYNIEYSDHIDALPPFSIDKKAETDLRGAHLLNRWTHTKDNGAVSSLQFYWALTDRESHFLTERRSTLDLDFDQTLAKIAGHQITWGVNYRYTRDQLRNGDLREGQARFFAPPERSDHLYSLFLQDEITLQPDHWWLTVGSKFDHNDYSGFEYQPNIRLRWQPNPGHTLWASISRAVRTPTRAEHDGFIATGLASAGPPPTIIGLLGNKDFESETVIAHELGYRFTGNPQIRLDLAMFYNRYDNLSTFDFLQAFQFPFPVGTILPVNLPTLPGVTANVLVNNNNNLAYGETFGLEAVLDWHPTELLQLKLSYSLLQMQIHNHRSSNSLTGEASEGSTPQQQFRIDLGYRFSQKIRLNLGARFVDKLPAVDIDSYVELDATIHYQLNPDLKISLTGQNLLDSQHLEARPTFFPTATSEVQRNLFLSIGYTF